MFKPPRRDDHKIERLNLIPIMDAVFIFIFFLLFSAQFIKIYEIASDAPVINEVPQEEKLKKDPLNLIIKVTETGLIVTTGVDSIVHTEIPKNGLEYDYEQLKKVALELKKGHLKEKYAIVAPELEIKYEYIVKIMDAVQLLPENKKKLLVNTNGKQKMLYKIFEQVVLEPYREE
jgi:biopolymer transport protein ExbD